MESPIIVSGKSTNQTLSLSLSFTSRGSEVKKEPSIASLQANKRKDCRKEDSRLVVLSVLTESRSARTSQMAENKSSNKPSRAGVIDFFER
jgi:hypothetical protein